MPPPSRDEKHVTGVQVNVVKRSAIELRELSRTGRERNIFGFGGVGEFVVL